MSGIKNLRKCKGLVNKKKKKALNTSSIKKKRGISHLLGKVNSLVT